MQTAIERVKKAIEELRQGKMIILTDHPDRENEGDLIMAAEFATAETMNFMIRQGTGIICVAMPREELARLQMPLMLPPNDNSSFRGTPFTVSVDAKEGITTGVSALDRAITINKMADPSSTAEDFVKPGHIFPLQAKEGGVLEREGHTEGSVDLVKLAGCSPAAVLCEIMNPDGTMMKGTCLTAFAEIHQLHLLSIDDLITYRLTHEDLIAEATNATLPLENYGEFNISIVKEKLSGAEHVVLINDKVKSQNGTLVRIHSSCLTGDLFGSQRCDCNKQLHYSLEEISTQGGVIIYLNQEGRGVGLFNKIKAYALQEKGYDTVEANELLGLPIDARKYHIAANIIRNLNIHRVQLLTNNPNKVSDLKKYGIAQVERIAMPTFEGKHNQFYLQTKVQKLNHTIQLSNREAL